MLRGLTEAADEARDWSVYVVRCSDGTLYTGVAKGVEARLAKHNSGRGAAYTRSRRPVRLFYREDGFTRCAALRREAGIKSLPRAGKEGLVAQEAAADCLPRAKRARITGAC